MYWCYTDTNFITIVAFNSPLFPFLLSVTAFHSDIQTLLLKNKRDEFKTQNSCVSGCRVDLCDFQDFPLFLRKLVPSMREIPQPFNSGDIFKCINAMKTQVRGIPFMVVFKDTMGRREI